MGKLNYYKTMYGNTYISDESNKEKTEFIFDNFMELKTKIHNKFKSFESKTELDYYKPKDIFQITFEHGSNDDNTCEIYIECPFYKGGGYRSYYIKNHNPNLGNHDTYDIDNVIYDIADDIEENTKENYIAYNIVVDHISNYYYQIEEELEKFAKENNMIKLIQNGYVIKTKKN